jgi:hypothetical protein
MCTYLTEKRFRGSQGLANRRGRMNAINIDSDFLSNIAAYGKLWCHNHKNSPPHVTGEAVIRAHVRDVSDLG